VSRSLASYLTAGFLLVCLGMAGTYAYDLTRRADTTRDLKVGRCYTIRGRRVRCVSLGDDSFPFRYVLWEDVRTGERGGASYVLGASFPRARAWNR
jgi:hypothetical protein